MVNAIITETCLGRVDGNIPFVILTFSYYNDKGKLVNITTSRPIFLITPETTDYGDAIRAILTIMDVVGVDKWELLVGKVVCLEIKDGTIVSFTNAINTNKKIQLIDINEQEQNISSEMIKNEYKNQQ